MVQISKINNDYADTVLLEAKNFYYKIKSIYDATGYSRSYQMGCIWKGDSENIKCLHNIINSSTNAIDSVRLVQNTPMFSVNPSDQIKEKMVDWYIAYLMRCGHDIFNLDTSIQESFVTDPNLCVNRAGRILTPDFMRTFILSLEIQKYCNNPTKSNLRIIELGGGCGHLARTLKFFIPIDVYIDIDIPESLYFAYIF